MKTDWIPTQEQLEEIQRRIKARTSAVTVGNRAVMSTINIMIEEYQKMRQEIEQWN